MIVRHGGPSAAAIVSLAALQGCSLAVGYLGAGNDDVEPDASTARASGFDASQTDAVMSGDAADAAAVADAASPGDAGNVITNPSCALGTSPWYTFMNGDAPVLRSTTAFSDGGGSACWVSNRGQTYEGPTQNVSAVTPGETYTLSAEVMVVASDDGGAGDPVEQAVEAMIVESCEVDGAASPPHYQPLGSGAANDSGWTPITGSYTAPTCPLAGPIVLYFQGPPAGMDLLVRNVSLAP